MLGPNSISQDDVVIAVMGATGVGKSTFIRLATRNDNVTVGHGLRSQTDTVQLVRYSRNNKNYVFLDTPGFNDTKMTDADILTNIVVTLTETYKGGIKLAGVIYLHRISDNRITMTDRKNTEMFTHFCGADAFQNVILVTTMWDHTGIKQAEPREMQLRTTFWKTMIDSGSRMMRFAHTQDSAWEIVDHLNGVPRPLQIQSEIVDQGLTLSQTAAGIALFKRFTQLIVDLRGLVKKLRESMGRSKKGSGAYGQDKARLRETNDNLKRVEEQKRKLESPSRSIVEVAKDVFYRNPPTSGTQRSASRQDIRDLSRTHGATRRSTAPAKLSSSPSNQLDPTVRTPFYGEQSAFSSPISSTLASRNSNTTDAFDKSLVRFLNLTEKVKAVSPRPVAGGGFSDIHQGEYGNHKVAIKVIRIFDDAKAENIERRLIRELNVWRSLAHLNIVPLLGYVDNMNRLPSPVSPWYENRDASNYLRRVGGHIGVKSRLRLLHQVAAGLQYLHQQKPTIIHGDLKPGNILIDDEGIARLCDFGLARLGEDGEATITGTVMCTPRYAAPELYSPRRWVGKVTETTRTDIYSLACIAYEFLYLKRPHADKPDAELTRSAYSPPAEKSREDWHPIPEAYLPLYWELFDDCWLEDQAHRPEIDHFCKQIDRMLDSI
ncbi:hypothetical protein FRB91_010091 [Serendipita sp. 411]|nr:hypothetical protein FRB91_010091 [Serendipita sp. 411]KAG8865672.1 hypothetical protein FRC20_009602 [Serendipita sp. 405]